MKWTSFGAAITAESSSAVIILIEVIVTFSVVEVVGQLRFDEPLETFVRTGVGMRTRAHFVSSLIHVTIAFGQSVEDNQVKIDLFLAIAVFGRQAVSPCVGVFGVMNH